MRYAVFVLCKGEAPDIVIDGRHDDNRVWMHSPSLWNDWCPKIRNGFLSVI